MTALASLLALIAILLLVSSVALLVAAEAATALVPRARVRRLVESDKPHAGALEALAERRGRVASAAALTAATTYAASGGLVAVVLRLTYDTPAWLAASLGVLAAVLLVFTFGEALPRTLALQSPERVALAAAPWALRLTAVVQPVARVLSAPWAWMMRLLGREDVPATPWVSPDEYGPEEEEPGREETEESLIDAVTGFAEKIVREVMVPRTDMAAIEDTAGFKEAVEMIAETGYTRIPLFHETVDDVRGVLYAKDLLLENVRRDGGAIRLVDIARPAYFVPETKPVEELLVEMRSKTHIAIVADEYGGTAGLVTIEDLLEEIVGEIFDEYDRQVQMVVDLGGERYRVDARLSVDDFADRFGTAFDVEADTIGGVFTEIAGRIPHRGEAVQVEGLRLVVEALEGNRIRQIVVEPAQPAPEKGEAT